METINIGLENSIYEELGVIIKAPLSDMHTNNNGKLEAFARLEASRKAAVDAIDYNTEREEAMNKKFGIID